MDWENISSSFGDWWAGAADTASQIGERAAAFGEAMGSNGDDFEEEEYEYSVEASEGSGDAEESLMDEMPEWVLPLVGGAALAFVLTKLVK